MRTPLSLLPYNAMVCLRTRNEIPDHFTKNDVVEKKQLHVHTVVEKMTQSFSIIVFDISCAFFWISASFCLLSILVVCAWTITGFCFLMVINVHNAKETFKRLSNSLTVTTVTPVCENRQDDLRFRPSMTMK